MAKITSALDKRTITGRKTKTLRKQGLVPTNVYGKKITSLTTQIPLKDFNQLFHQAGETNLIYLTIKGEKTERPCLISNIQHHPVTDEVIHVDFRQVDLSEIVTADIPLELVGESSAVATENATLVTQFSSIEIQALPSDLPDKFTLDLQALTKIGDNLKVSDLQLNLKKHKTNLDPKTVLVSVQAQQEEQEEEPVEEAPPEAGEEKEAEAKPTDQPAPKGEEAVKQPDQASKKE